MTDDARYRDALSFLIDGGARIAAAAPRLAPRLAELSRDPDVERLLEGVAYIVGQLETMVDRRAHVLHQLVFDLIAPGYLSPIPAVSTVELYSTTARHVPAGTELVSSPVEGTACRFRTAYDVEASTLTVADVQLKTLRGHAELTVRFEAASFPDSHPDRVRVLVAGELGAASTLHAWLCSSVVGVEWLDGRGAVVAPAPEISVRAVGFEPEASLWAHQVHGHRFELLKEYFAYPQKLLYLDLVGAVSAARRLGLDDGRFGLRFRLGVEGGRDVPVSVDTLRVRATPVVNAFPYSADPVQRRAVGSDILVRPTGPLGHYDVHQVVGVRSIGPQGSRTIPLLHELDVDDDTVVASFAQVHRKATPQGVTTWLHLEEVDPPPAEEVIGVDIWANNGRLPRLLRPGDLTGTVIGAHGVEVVHRFGVSPSYQPPTGEDVRRSLVQHMTLGHRPLTSREALSDAFGLYHFGALGGGVLARELELLQGAIVELTTRPKVFLLDGDSVRGLETEVVIDETTFSSEGEPWLFGSVIDELLAADAGLNVVSSLTLRAQKSGRKWTWPRRLGSRVLPVPARV